MANRPSASLKQASVLKLGVFCASLAVAALGFSVPGHAEKQADLEKAGYSCETSGVDSVVCSKSGEKDYLCDKQGSCTKMLVQGGTGGGNKHLNTQIFQAPTTNKMQ
jgi:hypothetical protein